MCESFDRKQNKKKQENRKRKRKMFLFMDKKILFNDFCETVQPFNSSMPSMYAFCYLFLIFSVSFLFCFSFRLI